MPEIKIDTFYSQLLEISGFPSFNNREKLILFFNIVKDFFNLIAETDKHSFTEFALFNFIINKYKFDDGLKSKAINFRKLINNLRKKQNFLPNNNLIPFYLQASCEFLSFLSKTEIPKELSKLFVPEKIFYDKKTLQKTAKNEFVNLRCVFANKIIENETIKLICINEDGEKILISTNFATFSMFNMLWKTCLICFTNLTVQDFPQKNISKNNHNNNEIKSSNSNDEIGIFYQTSSKTQAIIEPDYLIDVTEIVECFASKNENPIIPILNKFLNRQTNSSAFKGNIINSLLDELIENVEIDFDTALRKSLEKKPFAMLIYMQELQEKIQINSFSDLLQFMRIEFYNVFDNLRKIIIENFLLLKNSMIYVEPSFISNVFGMQGRLDLMIENQIFDDEKKANSEEIFEKEEIFAKNIAKNIDIIELKSGNAPNRNINISLGLREKRTLHLPLWINHYVQIICYNMLLQSSFPERKGFSSILYSNPAETNSLRNVVDNFFVQNEILTMRNWLVAYMRELSKGNLSIIETLEEQQISGFPSYSQDEIKTFIEKKSALTDLEKIYLKTQLAFISKEIFANKIGLFSNSRSFANKNHGFSSLWLDSVEEKKLKGNILDNLTINSSECNFDLMYICFDFNKFDSEKSHSEKFCENENIEEKIDDKNIEKINKIFCDYTTFRKGDICVVYQNNDLNLDEEKAATVSNQLLRGRITYIDEQKIIVSFRNKLSQKYLETNCKWSLEFDYMEKMNNYLFSSISDFILSKFANKNCIFGLEEPKFSFKKNIINAIEKIENLSDEKKKIISAALSADNYFLIQGPPGTGKTSYILRYLVQILFQETSENILLLTYTNRAADEICASLNKIINENNLQNFEYLRLGNKDSSEHSEKLISNISLENLDVNITNCRCFVSTVVTVNSTPEFFRLKKIDTVIIDEAAQILESSVIGLLAKVKKFIMIGDEKQLAAVTSITKNELIIDDDLLNSIGIFNLEDSLFERLLQLCQRNNWSAFAMLKTQSRMSERIMNLANVLFYQKKLTVNSDNITENHRQSNRLKLANSKAFNELSQLILFEDCFFIDTKIENRSKINLAEVEIVLKLIQTIKTIYGSEFSRQTVGIISPWRIQCSEILKRFDKTDRELITVDTVERFQGSERDIIIFSTATNNANLLDLLAESKIIDDVAVDRKLNVVITRAREKFIMLGNYELLRQKAIYSNLLAEMQNIRLS